MILPFKIQSPKLFKTHGQINIGIWGQINIENTKIIQRTRWNIIYIILLHVKFIETFKSVEYRISQLKSLWNNQCETPAIMITIAIIFAF